MTTPTSQTIAPVWTISALWEGTVTDPGFGQGGPIGCGGPTLKREGYTPDFIENCAKQRKMYAKLWG